MKAHKPIQGLKLFSSFKLSLKKVFFNFLEKIYFYSESQKIPSLKLINFHVSKKIQFLKRIFFYFGKLEFLKFNKN